MALPDLSNSMYVAHLRYIQAIYEAPPRRNPDTMVRRFIPMLRRLRFAWLRPEELSRMRSDPFYYYLVARTRYYDQVLENAVAAGVRRIVNVGCGSDTRAYRFKDLLRRKGVTVLECDQPESITAKKQLVSRWPESDHVDHLPIDLNDGSWPALEARLGGRGGPKTLVLMEGVSPYVNGSAFLEVLCIFGRRLPLDSYVTYDFKLAGIRDDFGKAERTIAPFRLPAGRELIRAYHKSIGLDLEHMELSGDLCARLVPGLSVSGSPVFEEDGLLQLRVT